MSGLTVCQPWASLIAVGAKRVETRDWDTPYRGPLAICAAKGLDGLAPLLAGRKPHEEDLQAVANASPFWDALWPVYGDPLRRVDAAALPRLAIVAVCNLAMVVPVEEQVRMMHDWVGRAEDETAKAVRAHAVERELAVGDYTAGRYAWRLQNVRLVDPPVAPDGVRYFRKLWNVPAPVAAQLP